MIDRRFFLVAATGAFAVEMRPLGAAAQPAWPNRPLRLVVGFSAGSTPDLIARTIAEPLSPLIGQPVVVENKPGASGNIAADLVAKARDDHTVGVMINLNLTIARLLNPALAFDPRRDLAPICMVGTGPLVLALSSRLAKEKAGIDQLRGTGSKLNYGSVGIGSMAHLGMEILSAKVGMTPTHVPYPGNPQVLAALASNEIDLALVPAGLAMPQVKGGTIGALAVASARRSSLAPDVPNSGRARRSGYRDRSVGRDRGLRHHARAISAKTGTAHAPGHPFAGGEPKAQPAGLGRGGDAGRCVRASSGGRDEGPGGHHRETEYSRELSRPAG